MKVLVIGGTRYMGKILVQTLLDEGNDVSVLSRGNEKPSWWNNINHIKADRNNENELKEALQNYSFDWVFDFQAYRKEHVESFGNIMNGRVGKYLFVSTGSVYSKWDYGPSEEALLDFELNIPFSEDQFDWSDLSYEYDPNELEYGARKRHCEKWIIENFNIPYTIIRIPAIMGEDDPSGRIWWWIQRIKDGKGIIVPENLNNPFRTLYSGDAAQAFYDSIKSEKTTNKIYHVASHEIFTPKSWIRILNDLMGIDAQMYLVPNAITDKFLKGLKLESDDLEKKYSPPLLRNYPYVHNLSKSESDFGFTTTDIKSWLSKTIEYYMSLNQIDNSSGYINREKEIEVGLNWENGIKNSIENFNINYI
jgi:nucleoside-diphosphate-sugar epimerase|tara:strand:+ start:472 stop:1563 length:1092 start_codon:yes stop_codon:yes gene_type:complete